MVRSFFNEFLASCNSARLSLLPGCNGGSVASKMKSVNSVPSS
jgi:hypothetical protein